MKYEYKLNKRDVIKYGFNYLICNGWFGIYADKFNEKWNENKKINISLSEKDISRITKNSIACNEY